MDKIIKEQVLLLEKFMWENFPPELQKELIKQARIFCNHMINTPDKDSEFLIDEIQDPANGYISLFHSYLYPYINDVEEREFFGDISKMDSYHFLRNYWCSSYNEWLDEWIKEYKKTLSLPMFVRQDEDN
jgi:hypothetical protein